MIIINALFKTFINIFITAVIAPQPIAAANNSDWLPVESYEQRQDFYIDKGELCYYILDLYKVTASNEPDIVKDVPENIKNLGSHIENIYALGLLNSTDTENFDEKDAVTVSDISDILYKLSENILHKFDIQKTPHLDFMVSRGIISAQEYVNSNSNITLKETISIIENYKNSFPDFAISDNIDNIKSEIEAIKKNKPRAYLTFDDGVSKNTIKILDTLKAENVKATFFITGTGDVDTIKRISDEGHTIGNHTYSHDYSNIYSSTENFWADFENEQNYLESIIGYKPTLFRFPGGSNNTVSNRYNSNNIMSTLINQAEEKGYYYVDWNVSAGDASKGGASSESIVRNIVSQSRNNNNVVILMHQNNGKETTAEALPKVIKNLKEMGYEILPLSTASNFPRFKVR